MTKAVQAEVEIEVHPAGPINDVPKMWYITDLDRIGRTFKGSRKDADAEAVRLAHKHPGNNIMVLETVVAYKRPVDRGYVLKCDCYAPREDS